MWFYLCVVCVCVVDSPRASARVAEGQRLPAREPQTPHPLCGDVLQVSLLPPLGDCEHLDTPHRLPHHSRHLLLVVPLQTLSRPLLLAEDTRESLTLHHFKLPPPPFGVTYKSSSDDNFFKTRDPP